MVYISYDMSCRSDVFYSDLCQTGVMCSCVCMYSASVRRTSMREKKAMSMKEAREEAQKLLESANVSVDDDEDDSKSNAVNGPPSTSAVVVRHACCCFAWLPRISRFFCCGSVAWFNSLESRGNYSAASNNIKLVHWPLMGGLLHLIQRGGDWAGPQPTQASLRCTKCNSPPINGQCTNHRIAV